MLRTNAYGSLFIAIISIVLLSCLLILVMNIMSSTKKISKQILYEKTHDNGQTYETVKRKTVFSGGLVHSSVNKWSEQDDDSLPDVDDYDIL